jgi:hypothetical protein
MRYLAAAAMLVVLAACGSRGALEPAPGASLPPAPYGARATPMPGELTTATTEQRPGRADDVLRDSVERQDDPFDLPPTR